MREPTNLGDFIASAHSVPLQPEAQVGVVRVWGDAEVAPALGAIVDYFGTYSDREAIRVVVGDNEIGYLDRNDVHGFGTSGGFGHSGRTSLPGLPLGAAVYVATGVSEASHDTPGVIEMRCPEEDCPDNPVYVAISKYYAGDPLMCKVHPDAQLEVHTRS